MPMEKQDYYKRKSSTDLRWEDGKDVGLRVARMINRRINNEALGDLNDKFKAAGGRLWINSQPSIQDMILATVQQILIIADEYDVSFDEMNEAFNNAQDHIATVKKQKEIEAATDDENKDGAE